MHNQWQSGAIMARDRTGLSITREAHNSLRQLQVMAVTVFQRPVSMSEALVLTAAQIQQLPAGVWQAAADKVKQED
jgi:hypothetical protein